MSDRSVLFSMCYSDAELRARLRDWLSRWPTDLVDVIMQYNSACPAGELVNQWDKNGSEDGEVIDKWRCTISGEGLLYMVDHHKHRMQVFSAEGKFVRAWG